MSKTPADKGAKMLHEGWKRATLGEIANIRSGSTPPREQHAHYFSGGIWPWVKTMDLTNGEIGVTDELISDAALEETSCRLFPKGTVLVAMYGGFNQIGRTGLLTKQSAINQAISAIELNKDTANPAYVLYWLNAHVSKWRAFAASSRKDPNITRGDVCGFPVSLPPVREQERIADVLRTWDKAIAATEKLLANSRKQKQALMQQLLYCRHRLPGFHGAWKEHRIGDVLREEKRPVQWDDDQEYPLISVRRRSGGAFHRETLKGHEILTKKLNTVAVGDFLISKMQVVHGAMAMVPPDLAHMYVSGSYITLRSMDDTQFDINFFGWLSATSQMYRHAYRSSYGVHIEKMTFDLGMFINERVSFPPTLGEQQAICAVLDAANRQIVNLQRSADQLREEKRALMQQLLTGKRRVKIDQPAAEASTA